MTKHVKKIKWLVVGNGSKYEWLKSEINKEIK